VSDVIEEGAIALILGLMTLITFANVVARYIFNSNILWALEMTVKARRIMTLMAVAACLAFSLLLLKGSWDYWWKFATKASFLETNDIPMPGFLQFLADWMNEGEAYEKIPRFIPYAVLPIGMALLTLRFAQAGWRVLRGEQDLLIVSHEAEDMVQEAAANADKEG
jgi:C4-dicarboxylate transporter DctQ subunit